MQLNRKNSLTLFLFLGTLVTIFVFSVNAETGTYQIQPQQQKVVLISLNSGDSASGTVVVNGEGAVDFWISDPQGKNVTSSIHSNIGQTEFSLNAETSGTFQFHIFNRSTSSNVNAVLNYNVVHRIFGMPQEMFLLLVVVAVVLILIAIWAVMSRI